MKCSVCGKEFELIGSNMYLTREESVAPLDSNASHYEVKVFESFDCPHCNCQNRVNRRFPKFEAIEIISIKDGLSDGTTDRI